MFGFVLDNWKWFVGGGVVAAVAFFHVLSVDAAYHKGYNKAEDKFKVDQAAADKKAQDKIKQIDTKKTKEIENARKENDALRTSILYGSRRLYVNAKCPPKGSDDSGLDNGETRAELNREDAEALIRIANEGDAAIIKMTALQEIVRALTGKEDK